MSQDWSATHYVKILGSKKVVVTNIPGYPLGEFRQLSLKYLKIIRSDPDLPEDVSQKIIGLKVISFLGTDDMKDLPIDHRVVFFRDIVSVFKENEVQEIVDLLEQHDFKPDDALDLAPEQFELID